MSPLAKTFVVLITIVAIGVFGISATLYNTQMNWKKVAQDAIASRDTLTTDYETKFNEQGQRMAQMSREAQSAHASARFHQGRNALLEQEVARERELAADMKGERDRFAGQVTEKDAELQRRANEVTELTGLLDAARSAEQSAKDAKSTAEERYARQYLDNQNLLEEKEKLQIELAAATEARDENMLALNILRQHGVPVDDYLGTMVMAPVDGTVVNVSNEDGLAVLSVGSNQGVKEGWTFTLYDGGKFIGKAIVTNVNPSLSGARLELTQGPIPVGAKASTRLAQ